MAWATGDFTMKLHVTVESASSLPDSHGPNKKPDTFCFCQVGNLKKASKYQRFQTPVAKDDCNPVWNHEAEVYISPGQPLEFQVYEKHMLSKLLGSAVLHSDQFQTEFVGELHLTGEGASGTIRVKVVPPYVLRVTLESAADLRNADGFLAGVSDPYCICQVAGVGRHWKGTRFQTRIVDNNLNPKWHHTQSVCINRGGTLEFQVWDSNTKPLPDQLLGEAKLDTENFLPSGWFGQLDLTGKKAQGTIFVRIIVEPPEALQSMLPVHLTAGMDGAALVHRVEEHAHEDDQLLPDDKLELKMTVLVKGANNLGTPVPSAYCICKVAGVAKATKYQHFQTVEVKSDSDPIWEHTGEISIHAGQDLEFELWNKRPFMTDQLLGKAHLSERYFFPNGFWGRPLQISGDRHSAVLTVEVTPPRIFLVTVISGHELPAVDSALESGVSDPYCICQIAGQRRHPHKGTRFRTGVIQNNLNPYWNFTSEICLGRDQSLEFQVWDKNTIPIPDKLLGSATLHAEHLHSREFEEVLQLTGKQVTGSLKVRIANLPPTMDRFPEALAVKIRLMAHAAVRWSTAQLQQRAADADAAYAEMDTVRKELVEIGALDAPTCHQLLDMAICSAAVTVGETIGLQNLRELREDFQHAHNSQHKGIGFMLWRQLEELFACGARLACAETAGHAEISYYKASFERLKACIAEPSQIGFM